MKPIIKKEQGKTILTSEVTPQHIVVGIRDKSPVILSKSNYDGGKYCFVCLDSEFTEQNCYPEFDTIKGAVEQQMELGEGTEVFEEENWKAALQWLIDNI